MPAIIKNNLSCAIHAYTGYFKINHPINKNPNYSVFNPY